MPKNTRRNNIRKKPAADQRRITQLLHNISVNTANEVTRMVPRVPDVERMQIRRDKVHTFSQAYTITDLSGSTTAPVGGAIAVQANNLTDFSAFSAIFDTYRILQVNVQFTPVQGPAGAGGTAPGAIYTALDYDDAGPPTAVSDLLGYETLLVTASGFYFERTFVPRASNALYSGAFTSFGSITSPWIDCASSTVQHYGLKWLINTSTQNARQWTVIVNVMISFRNQH